MEGAHTRGVNVQQPVGRTQTEGVEESPMLEQGKDFSPEEEGAAKKNT